MHIPVVGILFIACCLCLSCQAKAYHGTRSKCVTKQRLSYQLQNLFSDFASRLDAIEDYIQEPHSGPTYVRWGKTTCANTSERLYQGRMAGAAYNSQGGGANYLCLPDNPEYAEGLNAAAQSYRGEIFGAEFGGDSSGEIYPSDSPDKDIPCVVCETIDKSSILMIPAMRTCLPGWTAEYVGFLVSEGKYPGRNPKGYECMDETPDFINDGTDDNGAVIYPVQGRTKSLPSTYTDLKELSCVVCSK